MSSKSSVKVMPDAAEPMEAEQRAAIRKIGREYWDLLEKMAHE